MNEDREVIERTKTPLTGTNFGIFLYKEKDIDSVYETFLRLFRSYDSLYGIIHGSSYDSLYEIIHGSPGDYKITARRKIHYTEKTDNWRGGK